MNLFNKIASSAERRSAINVAIKKAIDVIERDDYQEIKKTYKVGFPDLIRIIRNEIRVMSKNGKVLWLVRKLSDGQYSVSFAIISATVSARLSRRFQVIWPQTWLLYYYCKPDQLYQVAAKSPYWALLDHAGNLQTTTARGLMALPENFVSAMGKSSTDYLNVTSDQLADISDMPILASVGLISGKNATRSTIKFNWAKLLTFSAVGGLCYGLILTLLLNVTESHLTDKTQLLQTKANAYFDEQAKLQLKLDALQLYTQKMNEQPMSAQILADITSAVPADVQLQNIRLNGRLLQISGQADSATAVLASFSNNALFTEAKFDRGVIRVREKESFTLSMVYLGNRAAGVNQ